MVEMQVGRTLSLLASPVLLMVGIGIQQASALTLEQARENCRESVGRPIVQSCMRGGGGSLEAFRTTAVPKVRACVESALKAANGRANVPVAIPSEPVPRQSREDGDAATPPGAFIAPPRTISDIAAILDSEKPDPKLIDELKAKADAQLPAKGSPAELARFYYARGNARAQLGRLNDALADANKAIEPGRGGVDANLMARLAQFAGSQYSAAGDPKQAFAIFSRQIREANAPGAKGFLFGGNRQISAILLQMGDIAQAEAFLRRNIALIEEARTSGIPGWRSGYALLGQAWEADVEYNRAIIFEARGQFREAETSYRLAEQRGSAGIKGVLSSPNPPPEAQLRMNIDVMVLSQARMKARQGRLAEAEADARRALLARLQSVGKYNPVTPKFIMGLAGILVEQGRYAEAETLTRVGIDISRVVGVADDSQSTATMLSSLGGILNLQRKPKEAATVYAQLDKAIAGWDPQRRETLELTGARIYSLYAAGQTEAGIAAAQRLLNRSIARVGEGHFDTATARGTLAVGYMRAGRDADAVREFKAAIPILTTAARENADDDTTVVAARSDRLQNIVEAYIRLLARHKDDPGSAVSVETFQLADTIRGHSVEQALAASSVRMIAKEPALADLVRKEQDLVKQVNAELGTLNNVLALPAAERDENGVKAINGAIDRLRAERDRARAEIGLRFPSYADLIDPKPPTAESIRETLRQGEVLISFYFGRESSFVWAVPKDGPVAFAPIAATAGEIESTVRKLREALEPQAAMISDIPPYDLALAYDLYKLLLGPVEAAWKPAKNLILVTNGALGLLPLSLLPTASAQVRQDEEPLFAGYRAVPWLARTLSPHCHRPPRCARSVNCRMARTRASD
jgi:tetratricopeptide (TPR) repeat protein